MKRSLPLRRRLQLVIALLGLLAIWPLAHRALVLQTGVSPWKFFGWAMYCEPRFASSLRFLAHPPASGAGAGGEVRPIRFPDDRPAARRALARYRTEELAWGELADPAPLARVLLATHPGLHRVEVRVERTRFDVRSAMPVVETQSQFFARRLDR